MNWINDAVVWVKTTKKGDKYLSFKAERDIKAGESLSLFKNDKGGNEMRPDFKAYHNSEDLMTDKQTQEVTEDIPF